MSGNASQTEPSDEIRQMAEFIGSAAKALALVAPKMNKESRQHWIGMKPAKFATFLEELIFIPGDDTEIQLGLLRALPKPAKKLLLIPVGKPCVVASVESFVVADKYHEGKITDGVNILSIWSLGPNFKKYALPYVENAIPGGFLVTHRLERNSRDEVIMTALGEHSKNSLAHIFEYLKTANHDNWYFSYVEIDDVVWRLRASWRSDNVDYNGWRIELYPNPRPGGWIAGDLLLSFKPS